MLTLKKFKSFEFGFKLQFRDLKLSFTQKKKEMIFIILKDSVKLLLIKKSLKDWFMK